MKILRHIRGEGKRCWTEHQCSDSTEVKLRGASGGSRECLLVNRVERQSASQSTCLSAKRKKEIMRWDELCTELPLRQNLVGVTVNELQSLYIWLCDAAGQWSIGRAKASTLPGPFLTKCTVLSSTATLQLFFRLAQISDLPYYVLSVLYFICHSLTLWPFLFLVFVSSSICPHTTSSGAFIQLTEVKCWYIKVKLFAPLFVSFEKRPFLHTEICYSEWMKRPVF